MQLSFDDLKSLARGGSDTITEKDLEEFCAATRRIYDLMKDGEWHSPDQIRFVAGIDGQPASEGLRRMRELRKWFLVERRRTKSGRTYEYRLTGGHQGDANNSL